MKNKNLIIGLHYTKDQLEEMKTYKLWSIAAELQIPKRPNGKYGFKNEMIPKILDAQEFNTARMDNLKAHFQQLLIDKIYSGRILNNSHRGEVVEMMVLSALGPEWNYVGLGWAPWDLQRGSGRNRVRIQVKNCAALQLWGRTQKLALHLGWSKQVPFYFFRHHPKEKIEKEGWFCELFVVGIHLIEDESICDHMDVTQWKFLVIPSAQLKRGQNSIDLRIAIKKWSPVAWRNLKTKVESELLQCRNAVRKRA